MAIPVIESVAEDAEVDVADDASTIASPSGLATGDWLFPIVGIEADGSTGAPFDDSTNKPTGCDLISTFGEAGNVDVWGAVYQRLVTGGESFPLAVAFNAEDAMADFCAITLRASGVNDANPVNAVGTPVSLTSAGDKIVTEVTTTENDCLAVAVMLFDGADCSPISLHADSVSAGWTIEAEHISNTGAVGLTLVVATKEQATLGATGACHFVPTASDGGAGVMFAIEGATVSGPAVTDVDTDETIVDAQKNVAVTVADFGGDITSIILASGSFTTANLLDAGTGTSYTMDLPDITGYAVDTAGVPFTSSNHTVVVRASRTGETDDLEVTFNPQPGWARVDVASGSTAEGSIFEDRAGGAPADTSQIYYPTASNTSITATGVITTDLDTVSGQLFNVSTGEWEPWTWEIASDTTPNQFTFTDVTNVALSTQQTSNLITVAGLDASASADVTITGGTYSKNEGTYTSDAGTAANGDTFTVRHTSSGSNSTAVNTVLTIGGVSDTFTSTTESDETPPTMPADTNVNVQENTTTVDTFAATAGTATITYALSGTDSGLFSINSGTGAVTFDSAPDFETPGDDDGDNVYEITVTATNSFGSDAQNITVTVQDVTDISPVINDQTFYVQNGATAGQAAVSPTATDAESDDLTWSITAGNTNTDWQINSSTGQISNLNTLDSGTTASYSLTVQVTDGVTVADTATITINVIAASTNVVSINRRRGRRF